jgi:hypothetical protein
VGSSGLRPPSWSHAVLPGLREPGVASSSANATQMAGWRWPCDPRPPVRSKLPADHYFFVPQVQLTSGDCFRMSAPKPIVVLGMPFTPDLQTWICKDFGSARPNHSGFALQTNSVGPSKAATDLDAYQRARLVSLARTDPPPGWTKWTLSRLADELVARGIVAAISPEEVRWALLSEILRTSIESESRATNRDDLFTPIGGEDGGPFPSRSG